MKKTVYFSENIFYAKENLDTIANRVISALSFYDFTSRKFALTCGASKKEVPT